MNEQNDSKSLSKKIEIKTPRFPRLFTPLTAMIWVAFIKTAMDEKWLFAIGFFVLGIYIVWLRIYSPKIIISSKEIATMYTFGQYVISWSEVEQIVYSWGNIFLEGNGKVLSFPGWEQWRDFNQQEAKEILEELSGRNVIVSYELRRYFPRWQNTQSHIQE